MLCCLSEIADVFVGMPVSPRHSRTAAGTVRAISVRCLSESGLVTADAEKVSLPVGTEQYTVHAQDVLIPARSTSLRVAVVPKELEGALINATVIGIRCSDALRPELLAAYFRHPLGQAAIASVCSSGTRQMNVTVSALQKIRVPVPPVEDQPRLVELLRAARHAYDNAIKAAETRSRTALQLVVSRMLDEHEPVRSS